MTSNAIVRIGFPWWLRPFLDRGTMAITLGRRVYIAAEHATEAVLRHELVHVRQVGELGLSRFLVKYVKEYIRNRRCGLSHDESYRAISFEVEAFAAERDQPV